MKFPSEYDLILCPHHKLDFSTVSMFEGSICFLFSPDLPLHHPAASIITSLKSQSHLKLHRFSFGLYRDEMALVKVTTGFHTTTTLSVFLLFYQKHLLRSHLTLHSSQHIIAHFLFPKMPFCLAFNIFFSSFSVSPFWPFIAQPQRLPLHSYLCSLPK